MSNMKRGSYEHGSYDIFDKLPRVVRRALSQAEYDWQVGPFLVLFAETGSASAVIADIRRTDLDEHRRVARRERRVVLGPHSRPIAA